MTSVPLVSFDRKDRFTKVVLKKMDRNLGTLILFAVIIPFCFDFLDRNEAEVGDNGTICAKCFQKFEILCCRKREL